MGNPWRGEVTLVIDGEAQVLKLTLGALAELEEALAKRFEAKGPYVVVIDTDPYPSTEHGGTWWDVGVPEVSERDEVNTARANYEAKKKMQRVD